MGRWRGWAAMVCRSDLGGRGLGLVATAGTETSGASYMGCHFC